MKRLILVLLVSCMALPGWSYHFQVDGVFYNILQNQGQLPAVEVTYETQFYESYSGVVVIPPTVTYISVTYTVNRIGFLAFRECTNLSHISIPSTVTSIGLNSFTNCAASVEVDANNSTYSSSEGVLFDKSKTTLLYCPGGKSDEYSIPSTVSIIDQDAFRNCDRITNLNIPTSVTTIRNYAFAGCTGLKEVNLPESVATIGMGVFANCSGLVAVGLPSSITTIPNEMFHRCTGLMSFTVPTNITTIGPRSFSDCTSLASVALPESVTSIGVYAFSGCSGLETLDVPSSVTSIGASAFSYTPTSLVVSPLNNAYSSAEGVLYDKNKTTLIHCPSTKKGVFAIPATVVTIEGDAFLYCEGLTDIQIPASVSTIGSSAFAYCSSLETIELPSTIVTIGLNAFSDCVNLTAITIPPLVTSIENLLFNNCINLVSVSLPSQVTVIGSSVFDNCESLSSIELPATLTKIGNYTFRYCKSLSNINIPDKVQVIGNGAFRSCTGLTTIVLPASLISLGSNVFADCNATVIIDTNNSMYTSIDGVVFDKAVSTILHFPKSKTGEYTIPATITELKSSTFDSCKGLTSITIPQSVTQILDFTFASCTGLQSIEIPSTVKTIGSSAFQKCTSLQNLSIPASVSYIGHFAFRECTALINVNSGNTKYSSIDGVLFTNDFSALIHCPSSIDGNYSIPTTVKSISDYAFYNNTGLKSISIPSTVNNIRPYAFSGCFAKLTVEVSNTDYSSFEDMLYTADKKTLLQVTNVANGEFVIPSMVTTLGELCFSGCTEITSIKLPSTVTLLKDNVFSNCMGLKTISIPSSIQSLGNKTFSNCVSLEEVSLPATITFLKQGVFYDCSALKLLTLYSDYPPKLVGNVFYNVDKTSCVLKVPIGSKKRYLTVEEWSEFKNIEEFDATGFESLRLNNGNVYPNPAIDIIHVIYNNFSEDEKIILCDLHGRTLMEKQLTEQNLHLNISGYPSGMYILIRQNKANQTKLIDKFVKL